MKRFKKSIVVLTSVGALLGLTVCLIALNNSLLLNLKAIVSNYILCQKSDYVISTDMTDSGICKTLIFKYIDSNKGYDYYLCSFYNGAYGETEKDYFVKKSGDKIIASFDLKELNLPTRNDMYKSCGFYIDGNLYFTIEGMNSIFLIDEELKDCKVWFTPNNFGKMNYNSFCVVEDIFYYITDSGSLVKFDGMNEEQIKMLPQIPTISETEDDFSSYSYYLNNINGEFYFGAENNLFRVKEDGKVEYLNFEIPSSSSTQSCIYRIGQYESDSNIMVVSFFYSDVNLEKSTPVNIRYLIDTQNGNCIKCKQRANKRCRVLSYDDILNYIKQIESVSNIAE